MTAAAEPLLDHLARARATSAITETVVVAAGAGSGKTRVLVDRLCALVTADPADGGTPMRHVAAVTFTEKAAAELRDRVRARLSEVALHEQGTPAGDRAGAALEELDAAAIGTLHSFAQRILREHPIEACLPPVVEVLDEVASSTRFDRWWSDVRARLLDDPTTGEAIRLLRALNVRLEPTRYAVRGPSLRALAERLQNDWDLVEDRLRGLESRLPTVDVGPLRSAVNALLERCGECSDDTDKLLARVRLVGDWAAGIDDEDSAELLRLLSTMPSVRAGNVGKGGSWPDIASIRADLLQIGEIAKQLSESICDRALLAVLAALVHEVLDAADERRREGRLLFHDLLVLARRMLRRAPEARAALQRRYQRLLLDEFQDTDPIQVEIAARIAAGIAGDDPDWRAVPLPPGSLFIVGDPKQSIYRFRRADITTYLAAQHVLSDGHVEALVTNFRSDPRVIDWVNHTFGRLMHAEPHVQPQYERLSPPPDRPRLEPTSPRVAVLAAEPLPPGVDEAREREALQVAGLLAQALQQQWDVDEEQPTSLGERRWVTRPLRARHVTILVPSRTSVPYLERALDDANVPYRVETSSLVYSSDEVRDLLLVVQALDDPTDEVAVVEALRTPILGCGDDDLWRWRAAGGRWTPSVPRPEGIDVDDPVAVAMHLLGDLIRRRRLLTPSLLLDEVVRRRRVLESLASERYCRDAWRRLRFVIDQARAWSDAEHGSLREYLAWARLQASDESRARETVLPETDTDAVRIMTIHSAKGLQFPFVVVAGMVGAPFTNPGVLVWTANGAQVSLGKDAHTSGWSDAKAREVHLLEAEDLRLLYVACTRAQSRLVVSLARPPDGEKGGVGSGAPWRGALLAEGCDGAKHVLWEQPEELVRLPEPAPSAVAHPGPFDEYLQAAALASESAAVRAADSATDIAHGVAPWPEEIEMPAGLVKEPRDLELPAWVKGRYGAAVGRAVHATLQTVDLLRGHALETLAAGQALAEGIAEQTELVVALARSGWSAPIVRYAASRRHHREIYVGGVVGGRLVEGYVDLLVEQDDGSLVIVDYKTDADPDPETVQAYQRQLAVYAHVLRESTGRSVGRGVLLFCREGEAVEVDAGLT